MFFRRGKEGKLSYGGDYYLQGAGWLYDLPKGKEEGKNNVTVDACRIMRGFIDVGKRNEQTKRLTTFVQFGNYGLRYDCYSAD